MSNEILITFIGVNNEQGIDLVRRVEQIVSHEFEFAFHVLFEPTINEHMAVLLNSDVVIIDGSIEPGHTYDNATMGPLTLDYVWMVSRTYLPTNYQGIVEGGYPKYSPDVRKSFDNGTISDWIRNTLAANKIKLPRKGKGSLIRYFRDINAVIKALEETRKKQYQVFISYRSNNIKQAEKLKLDIENGKFHNGVSKKVYLIQPGELVFRDELLTAYKRWQIQCIVRNYIDTCEEIWVLNDADDHYFQSWWTQGELVSLSYRSATFKIKVYNIKENKVIATPEHYKIPLSNKQKDRLGRWYSNTDPALMNAASRFAMKAWKNVPLIGRHSYFSDAVWQDEFWDFPAFYCATCAKKNKKVSQLDVEYFLWLNQHRDLVFLNPQEAEMAKQSKKVTCPRCNTIYSVTEEAPRYVVYFDKKLRDAMQISSSLIEERVYRISK